MLKVSSSPFGEARARSLWISGGPRADAPKLAMSVCYTRIAKKFAVASKYCVLCPVKYLHTGKLSFSACLAENPGALKLENLGFYARNARRMTSHPLLGVTGIS